MPKSSIKKTNDIEEKKVTRAKKTSSPSTTSTTVKKSSNTATKKTSSKSTSSSTKKASKATTKSTSKKVAPQKTEVKPSKEAITKVEKVSATPKTKKDETKKATPKKEAKKVKGENTTTALAKKAETKSTTTTKSKKNETKTSVKSPAKKASTKSTAKTSTKIKATNTADKKASKKNPAKKVEAPELTLSPDTLDTEKKATTKSTSTPKAKTTTSKATKKTTSKLTAKASTKTKKKVDEITPKVKKEVKKASTKAKKKASDVTPKVKKEVKKTTAKVKKKAEKAIPAVTDTIKKVVTKAKKKINEITSNFLDIVEYYDLPYRYNQTVVKVLAQNPNTLFVYWDVHDSDIEYFKKQYGDNFLYITKPVLVVHNVTQNYSFEIDINDFANNWYIHVDDSKCKYIVELGRRPNQSNEIFNVQNNEPTQFVKILSSNEIENPNDRVLFYEDNQKLHFKNIKTNVVTEKIVDKKQTKHFAEIYKYFNFDGETSDKFDFENPSSNTPTSNVMK